MKPGLIKLLLLAAIIAAGLLMWQAAGVKTAPKPAAPAAVSATSPPAKSPTTVPTLPPTTGATAPPATGLPNTAPGADGLREEYSLQLHDILTANDSTDDSARKLLSLMPQLNTAEQADASQHIANLLADAEFSKVTPYILNPATPREVMDVFYGDALNRSDEIKLPILVELAEKPGHPLQEEAMNILDVFLGPDYTENRPALRQLAQKYLAEQAEQNAPAPNAPPAAATK